MRSVWKVVPLICALSAVSAADIVYTNGPDGHIGGNFLTSPGAGSQEFTLATDSTLTSLTISTWTMGGGPSTLDWNISTGPTGTGELDSGSSAVTNTFNSTSGNYSIYNSEASLPAVPLSAGTYWLTLSSNGSSNGEYVYWGVNNPFSPANASYTCNDNCSAGGNGWINTSSQYDNVLELDGTIGSPTAVPEPSLVLLLGSVLLGLLAWKAGQRLAA